VHAFFSGSAALFAEKLCFSEEPQLDIRGYAAAFVSGTAVWTIYGETVSTGNTLSNRSAAASSAAKPLSSPHLRLA
jgi:hypothetical protein